MEPASLGSKAALTDAMTLVESPESYISASESQEADQPFSPQVESEVKISQQTHKKRKRID